MESDDSREDTKKNDKPKLRPLSISEKNRVFYQTTSSFLYQQRNEAREAKSCQLMTRNLLLAE